MAIFVIVACDRCGCCSTEWPSRAAAAIEELEVKPEVVTISEEGGAGIGMPVPNAGAGPDERAGCAGGRCAFDEGGVAPAAVEAVVDELEDAEGGP